MARRMKTEDPVGTAPGEAFAGDDSETMSANTGNGDSFSEGIADSGKQAINKAKDAAARAIDEAKDQASSRVDQQREAAATGFQAVAHAFRSMGDNLRSQDQGPVAQYAAEIGNAMGGQIERLATYLRGRDLHQLVSDAEDYARRSPAVFLGGSFVLGLAASRFLKSSRRSSGSSLTRHSNASAQDITDRQLSRIDPSRAITGETLESGWSESYDRDLPNGPAAPRSSESGGGFNPAGEI